MTTFVHLVTPLGDMKLVTIWNTWKMNLNFGIVLDSDFDLIRNDPKIFSGLRSIFDFYLSSIEQLVPKWILTTPSGRN